MSTSILSGSSFILPLLRSLARDVVAKKMEGAEEAVVLGMKKKGMTPDKQPLQRCIRDALFRLIRKVIPSGDISDAIRDFLDARVIEIVQENLLISPPPLQTLVTATREAAIQAIREAVG